MMSRTLCALRRLSFCRYIHRDRTDPHFFPIQLGNDHPVAIELARHFETQGIAREFCGAFSLVLNPYFRQILLRVRQDVLSMFGTIQTTFLRDARSTVGSNLDRELSSPDQWAIDEHM